MLKQLQLVSIVAYAVKFGYVKTKCESLTAMQ